MSMSRRRLRGLYAITDATLQRPGDLYQRVKLAIEGGAGIVQYRDKSSDARFRLRQARELVEVCKAADACLIINDDVHLAADCGADGIHLGRNDSNVSEARRLLGDSAIIGSSCYNSLDCITDQTKRRSGRHRPDYTKQTTLATAGCGHRWHYTGKRRGTDRRGCRYARRGAGCFRHR